VAGIYGSDRGGIEVSHSLYSPSAAHRWTICAGSLVLEAAVVDVSSSYADEGTAAHEVASLVLGGTYAHTDALLGERVDVSERSTVVITDEMVGYVQQYVDYVQDVATGGLLMVEQRVHFGEMIGAPNDEAFGTADAVAIVGDHMHVIHLKYGKGVAVEAQGNLQLALYALGCLQEYSGLAEIAEITMTVHQPRAGGVSSWTVTRAELEEIALQTLAPAVQRVMAARQDKAVEKHLTPNAKGCRWCKAKATCPALGQWVQDQTAMDFDDLGDAPKVEKFTPAALARAMAATELVEGWVQAVRAETSRRLHNGQLVPGYKLVEGRKGFRRWSDEAEAQEHLVTALQNAAFERKLISPAAAEKALKKHALWPALAALTTQSAGSPTVAPADDRRPAYDPANQFDNLEDTP
jgi:hypothetical protein